MAVSNRHNEPMNSNLQSVSPGGFNPAQRFVDRQMASILETILTHSYSLANRGLIPSDEQLSSYVETLDEAVLLRTIRKHPGAAATPASRAQDAELLRWARLAGQEKVN